MSVTIAMLFVLTQGCCCCDKCCDTRCKADEYDAARAALYLAKATVCEGNCDCKRSGVCRCDPADCRCGEGCVRQCKAEEDDVKALGAFMTYKAARAKVERDGGRMVVWVGGVCGICVRKLSDHIHTKLPAWDGIDGHGVVLIEGDGKGDSTVLKVWEGFPPAQEIRDTRLKKRQAKAAAVPPPAPAETVYLPAPAFFAPPVVYYGQAFPPPAFGGCASGCCGGCR